MSLVLKIVSVESRIDQSKSGSQEMTMSMQSEKACEEPAVYEQPDHPVHPPTGKHRLKTVKPACEQLKGEKKKEQP